MLAVAWLTLVGGASAARAQKPPPAPSGPAPASMSGEARAHYDRGLGLYAAKDYAAAVAELEAGYALDPRREFLFAEAQAQRLAGDCQRAVPLYQRFLATLPAAVQVNAAQVGLARCAQQLAITPPVQQPPPMTPAPPPAPWYRDSVGGALLSGGVLGLGVGAGFLIAAAVFHNHGANYDDYNQQQNNLERRANIGVGALVTGALLTGAAAYRYHRLRSTPRSPAPVVSGAVTPTFRGLLLEGRF